MKKWGSATLAAVVATILSGCGGGGGDGDDTPTPAADTTAPAVSLTASSQSVESGVNVSFTMSANDAKDGAITPTLSCDGGTVTGTTLATPDVDAAMDIQCTASATDAAGNRGTTSLTIHVTPVVAQLELPEELQQLQPGQVGLLFASDLPIDQPSYTGSLGGQEITVRRGQSGVLTFAVPTDMQAGTQTLQISVGDRSFSYEIDVTAAATIADPKAVVLDAANAALTALDAALADGAAGRSEAEIARAQQDRAALAAAIDDIDTYDAATLQATAAYLVANGLTGDAAPAAFGAAARFAKFDAAQCWSAADSFKMKHIATITAGAIAIGGALTGNPLLAVIAGAATIYNWDAVLSSIDIVMEKCLVESELTLIDPASETMSNGRKYEPAIRKPLDVSLGFDNDEARTFRVRRTMTLDDSVIAGIQNGFNQLADLIVELPYVPQSVADAVQGMKTQTSEFVPAGAFSLTAISRNDISGAKGGSGDDMTLTFKAVEPEEENIDFTFQLVRADGDPINVTARLMLDLPEAEDASIIVTQGKAMQSDVVVRGADTLEIVASPSHGAVTLDNDGSFAYEPSGQYFGPDSFTYRARNEDGVSETATVTIDVQRKFEGVWQVTATQQTTSESSEGLCSSEDGTTSSTYTVTKISPTQYSAGVGGDFVLQLSMPSADSPGGLSGTLSVQYPGGPDDEGIESETLSISIPDSSHLSGSSSWSYSYSADGYSASCSGTTEITGTR